jgi:cation diffusion facilitator family transporter
MANTRFQEVRFVLWWVLVLNLLVAFAKLTYGLHTASLSLQADGFHSLFDGVSNIIGLIGIWIAAKPPDTNHPYGHHKFETLAAAGIALMLTGTCAFLLWKTWQSLSEASIPQVTNLSYGVVIGTILINLGVTTWERHKGRALGSQLLLADSYHTASDVLVSLSVLGGLIAVQWGYPMGDPVIALVIVVVIAGIAWTLFREITHSLVDTFRVNSEDIRSVVMTLPSILDCHQIRTRGLPHHIFVDLSIHVDPQLSVEKSHEIANAVEETLKSNFPGVEDVVVHIEPEGH